MMIDSRGNKLNIGDLIWLEGESTDIIVSGYYIVVQDNSPLPSIKTNRICKKNVDYSLDTVFSSEFITKVNSHD